jgi:transcriptional repressor NrdR
VRPPLQHGRDHEPECHQAVGRRRAIQPDEEEVEENVRASGVAEIDAHEVGLAILGPLRKLDQIAYLRFASVYQGFESLEDFEEAIQTLRQQAKDNERVPSGVRRPLTAH